MIKRYKFNNLKKQKTNKYTKKGFDKNCSEINQY